MVTTVYNGANADIIASQVTKPLEEVIAEANGIRALSSILREQVSIITVEFNLDADLEAAANDVRDKVSKSRQQLPSDIEPTIVEKTGSADFLVFLLCKVIPKAWKTLPTMSASTSRNVYNLFPEFGW